MSFLEELERRLEGSKFRLLNDKMYRNAPINKSEMRSYHKYYSAQIKKWPVNPLDIIISKISDLGLSHLKIADLGCGEAKLALKFKDVHSYDISAANSRVTECNMENIPLPNNCMDVVVCCLSLMMKYPGKSIMEVNRILKNNGWFFVAEVKSRLVTTRRFITDVEKCGFKLSSVDSSNTHFVIASFNKTSEYTKQRRPNIRLNPCFYKRR